MARLIARAVLVILIIGPAIVGWWTWDANLATAIYMYVLVVLLGPTLLLAFGSPSPARRSSRPPEYWSDLPWQGGDGGDGF